MPTTNPIIHRFNVILTFKNAAQKTFDVELRKLASEKSFVSKLIKDEKNLAELLKISTCLTGVCRQNEPAFRDPTYADLPKYLAARSGKFYFTDEDKDTRTWKALRDSLVKARNKKSTKK